MTLDELKQIKDSLDKGVIVSKATWLRVLDAAIESKTTELKTPKAGGIMPQITTAMNILADGERIRKEFMEKECK